MNWARPPSPIGNFSIIRQFLTYDPFPNHAYLSWTLVYVAKQSPWADVDNVY